MNDLTQYSLQISIDFYSGASEGIDMKMFCFYLNFGSCRDTIN